MKKGWRNDIQWWNCDSGILSLDEDSQVNSKLQGPILFPDQRPLFFSQATYCRLILNLKIYQIVTILFNHLFLKQTIVQMRFRFIAFQAVLVVKNPPASAGDVRDTGSIPELGRFSRSRKQKPTQVFLPGKWTENPMGHEESDMTEHTRFKLGGRCRDVPHSPCSHTSIASSIFNVPHQNGTFVAVSEPTLTYHYDPTSIFYPRVQVHSYCSMLCV